MSAERLVIAASEGAYDRLVSAAAVNDLYGIDELVRAREVVMVPTGTRVLVLGGVLARHVRILDGKNTGREAWVSVEHVR